MNTSYFPYPYKKFRYALFLYHPVPQYIYIFFAFHIFITGFLLLGVTDQSNWRNKEIRPQTIYPYWVIKVIKKWVYLGTVR